MEFKPKKNKKILIATGLFPPQIGGPATYSKILARELPKKGFEVEILNFGDLLKFPKILRHLIYFLKALFLGQKAEMIFAQDPVSVGLPAILAAKILRKKFILKIVGDYAWEQARQRFGVKDSLDDFVIKKYGFKTELLRKMEKLTAHNASAIITPSFYLKKIVASWGVAEQKIKVIYNTFDSESFKPDFSEKKDIILSVGRLVPWKGFSTLIDLMKELPEEIKLVIAGSGTEEQNLRSKIESLKLAERVILVGQIGKKELNEYFGRARLFVLNTQYEGLPHSVLEAMAVGVPVVTTNIGGNPEVIKDGFNGLLISYNDKEALKGAILTLWSDENLRKKFTVNSFEELKKFSLEGMINKTAEILI